MECVLCEEPITNPICPACLQKGIQQWMLEEGRDEMVPELHEITRNIFLNQGETFCVKCESCMSVCAYCYTQEVFQLVKRRPEMLGRYLTYFNYDLGHLGWEREARKIEIER